MEYLDFELEVAAGDAGDYVVSVLRSPAGEARQNMRFPYDQLQLRNKVQALQIALLRSGGPARRSVTPEDRSVEDLGRDLFAALFGGDTASRLEVTRSLAHQQGRGVRLKLRISAPELLGLPWEYLYDPAIGDYVALSVGTPLVRYIPLPQHIEPLEVTPPIRVLGMIAGPKDLGDLDGERERSRLEMALKDLSDSGVVELHWVPGETWEDLQEALWAGPWHIFHFVGHGGFNERQGHGVLYFADAEGKSRELSATDLARLLGDHDALRLAVLNSCDTAQGTQTDIFSSTAAALVRRGTPAVVAMQFQITDAAAIQFSRVFYRAIARGMPVDAAVAEARKSIALQVANSLEWGTPVLFMRSPDGVLFKIPPATAAIVEEAASGTDPAGMAPAAVTGGDAGGAADGAPPDEAPRGVAAAAGVAFQVGSDLTTLPLDEQRRGKAEYTVRNLTGKRLRVRASVAPQGSATAAWFAIEGPTELVFEVGAEQRLIVNVAVDEKAKPGAYSFRLDVASVTDPDDEWANGPTIAFEVPAPPIKPKKPFPWKRVLIIAGGVVALALGAGAAFAILGGDAPDLVVTAIRMEPENPTANTSVQLEMDVKNEGGGAAGRFTAILRAPDGERRIQLIAGLDAGETRTLILDWTPPAGAHEIVGIADLEETVDESDEENNRRTAEVTVQAPPDPTPVPTPAAVNVTVVVDSITINAVPSGGFIGGDVEVDLTINGQPISISESNVLPGKSINVGTVFNLTLGPSDVVHIQGEGTYDVPLFADESLGSLDRQFGSAELYGQGFHPLPSNGCGCFTVNVTITPSSG